MTKHELVQELLDKRYVYQDLGSIIEEDIYNNEPYFVDKNLINLNGVARYRYTEEKRNLTEYDEYALIELKKSGLKHLTDTRFIFSKDLLENYVDVDNLILVKELVNDVLVFSLLRSINGLEVVIHNRVTKEEIIAYFKQVTEAIATYPIKYVYGDAVHITRVVNSFVNSGLNTKINSNSSIINISVNDNTFAKEVQEQEIVNSTQPGRELQNYISEKDAIGEEYANNLIGYLKLINSSDYEDISISDGVFIEPVQVLTISIRLNSLEVGDNGNIDITFTLATNDSLPISRTEPLSIDISCLDELNNDSNYFDYDFGNPKLYKQANLSELLNKEVGTGNSTIEDIIDIFDIWLAKRDPMSTYQHPTQKPPSLHEKAIKRCTKYGDQILDWCAGSGSLLIACEQMKRKCYAVEIEPVFCDVIAARWEELTGLRAKLFRNDQEAQR
jgi:hypothetical protein